MEQELEDRLKGLSKSEIKEIVSKEVLRAKLGDTLEDMFTVKCEMILGDSIRVDSRYVELCTIYNSIYEKYLLGNSMLSPLFQSKIKRYTYEYLKNMGVIVDAIVLDDVALELYHMLRLNTLKGDTSIANTVVHVVVNLLYPIIHNTRVMDIFN